MYVYYIEQESVKTAAAAAQCAMFEMFANIGFKLPSSKCGSLYYTKT